MEPVITLVYLVSSLYGYVIGADMYNYYIYRRDYIELKRQLDYIDSRVDKIVIGFKIK